MIIRLQSSPSGRELRLKQTDDETLLVTSPKPSRITATNARATGISGFFLLISIFCLPNTTLAQFDRTVSLERIDLSAISAAWLDREAFTQFHRRPWLAETALLHAVVLGDVVVCVDKHTDHPSIDKRAKLSPNQRCLPTEDDPDTFSSVLVANLKTLSNDPSRPPHDTIRADFLRWLVITPQVVSHIDPHGIRLYGARIDGRLDLSFAKIPIPLVLAYCRIDGGMVTVGSFLVQLALTGSAIGQMNLVGSNIENDLDLSGAILSVHPNGQPSKLPAGAIEPRKIAFDGSRLKASRLLLRDKFRSEGAINLEEANLGALDMLDGSISNHCDTAFSAIRMKVTNGLRFGTVDGTSFLSYANIGTDLGFYNKMANNGCVSNWNTYYGSLFANGIHVNGIVEMKKEFMTDGKLFFASAEIDHNFKVEHATFHSCGHLNGFIAEGLSVKSDLFWKDVHIDKNTVLDLQGAVVGGQFQSDRSSWPQLGNLLIAHFTYTGINVAEADYYHSVTTGITHETRIPSEVYVQWLNRQPQQDYSPQPYRSIAKCLDASGDREGSTKVMIAMEDARLKANLRQACNRIAASLNVHFAASMGLVIVLGFLLQFFRGLRGQSFILWLLFAGWVLVFLYVFGLWSILGELALKGLINYGYSPLRTVLVSSVIVAIGTLVVNCANAAGLMKYTGAGIARVNGEQLSAFLYSLNVFLPVIDLHQEKYWWPDAERLGTCSIFGQPIHIKGRCIRAYLWCQIMAGWLLGALLLASIGGLIKHD